MMHSIRLFKALVLLAIFGGFAQRALSQEAGLEPAAGEVMLLKLAAGGSLWGRISGHDAERLSFQRLDNSGIVRMPWKQIEPGQSGQLLEECQMRARELVHRRELDDGLDLALIQQKPLEDAMNLVVVFDQARLFFRREFKDHTQS